MFLTVHATTAAVIGQQTGNIWLAFAAGFISHFVLDVIPHGDQELSEGGDKFTITAAQQRLIKILGISDSFIMASLVGFLVWSGLAAPTLPVLAAAAGAIAPDYINAFYIFFKVPFLKQYFSVHYDLHFLWKGFTITFKQGLALQAVFLTAMLAAVIIF